MCKKILIVDDDLNFVNRIIDNCFEYDCSIAIASSISQAKSILEEDQFDIIVANTKVPGGNSAILKSKIKNETKLLFMSSLNDSLFNDSLKNEPYIFKYDFINNFKGYLQSV